MYFPIAYAGELCPYILVSYANIPQFTTENDSEVADAVNNASPTDYTDIADNDISDVAADTVAPNDASATYAATTKTFKEITSELTIEYNTNNGNLCGVRISTNNSNFYLKYRSMNVGHRDWLDYVYSTKSGIHIVGYFCCIRSFYIMPE